MSLTIPVTNCHSRCLWEDTRHGVKQFGRILHRRMNRRLSDAGYACVSRVYRRRVHCVRPALTNKCPASPFVEASLSRILFLDWFRSWNTFFWKPHCSWSKIPDALLSRLTGRWTRCTKRRRVSQRAIRIFVGRGRRMVHSIDPAPSVHCPCPMT